MPAEAAGVSGPDAVVADVGRGAALPGGGEKMEGW